MFLNHSELGGGWGGGWVLNAPSDHAGKKLDFKCNTNQGVCTTWAKINLE